MMKQLELYPDAPGFQDSKTSRAAAEKVKPRDKKTRARCLELLRQRAMTCDEIAAVLHLAVTSIRPRVCQLFQRGEIFDTGLTRNTVSGSPATVWKAK